ncbi:MAG: glycosyltransferase family 2 protein [Planctomycetota bacterium]
MSEPPRAALRLGILVPCRDEAGVVARKLANLALLRWPEGARHRIVVVDDGSSDGTRELAQRAAEIPGVSRAVVPNRVRPGKPGAIGTGLDELGEGVDLVVLTDADVVIEPDALLAIERAFAGDPRLAMACGAQRFVADLAGDGTLRSASLGPLADASEPFDRWTARVRRLESRSGRLFSVHGQLLAWRASLGLRPRPGLAADDLDLVMQVRARLSEPRRVEILSSAVFVELKTPAGAARRAQALRRARAYVQLVRAGAAPASDALSRAQTFLYRSLPLASPELTVLVPLAVLLLAMVFLGTGGAILAAVLLALALTSPPGWRWAKLVLLIRAARRMESEGSLPERWEMARR